jgi:transposase
LTTLVSLSILSSTKSYVEGRKMPRPKTYVVILTDEQQEHLLGFLKQGAAKARMLTRARILLLSAAGNTDRFIADVLQVTPQTVRNIRKRFAEEGLEAALQERPRPGAQPKLDGKQEAFLVALACSAPPEGREHWTMQLLADRLVELGVVESISDETVRRVLKKTTLSPGRSSSGALDRLLRTSSGAWKMCWTCTPNLTTHDDRSSALTNGRISWWRMSRRPCRWSRGVRSGWTTHMSGKDAATCF